MASDDSKLPSALASEISRLVSEIISKSAPGSSPVDARQVETLKTELLEIVRRATSPRLAGSIDELAGALGISRALLYQLFDDNDNPPPLKKAGDRSIVLWHKVGPWLDGLPAWRPAGRGGRNGRSSP